MTANEAWSKCLFLAKTFFLVQTAHMVSKTYPRSKCCFQQLTEQNEGEKQAVQKEGLWAI